LFSAFLGRWRTHDKILQSYVNYVTKQYTMVKQSSSLMVMQLDHQPRIALTIVEVVEMRAEKWCSTKT